MIVKWEKYGKWLRVVTQTAINYTKWGLIEGRNGPLKRLSEGVQKNNSYVCSPSLETHSAPTECAMKKAS